MLGSKKIFIDAFTTKHITLTHNHKKTIVLTSFGIPIASVFMFVITFTLKYNLPP